MFNTFAIVLRYLKVVNDTKLIKETQEIQRKSIDLKKIKKLGIWYVVLDRKSKEELKNLRLCDYNEKYHELLVDAHQYMKLVMN